MKNVTCYSLALLLLTTVLPLTAGTFSADFNSGTPPGSSCYGTLCYVDGAGGPDGSGSLRMTTGVINQTAGFIMDNFDANAPITAFTATFQLVLGGGDTGLADGFSFNYASDLPDGTITEEGAGSGLSVAFDTYPNSTTDLIGIDVKWRGAQIATYATNAAFMARWPNYVNVSVQLTNGALSVAYGNTVIYTNLALPGFTAMPGRFGLGARTGGADENCWVDNLAINTTPLPRPIVLSVSPTGTGVAPNPTLSVLLEDGVAQVDQGSIEMTFNGAPVAPTPSYAAPYLTNTYAPDWLPSGSTNIVSLSFADTGSPVLHYTTNLSFVVANYPALPPNYAALADTAQPGFTERIFQGGAATVGTVELADQMLAGQYYNTATGQLWPNTAQTNADGSWTFVETNVLNYNIYTNTTNPGYFGNDAEFPGLPGTNGSLANFAVEAVTYLYLTPGNYTFGVDSDDGFRATCLDKQLGLFNAGRGAAETLFYCTVAQTGYYPIRLVYFQGTGASSLEFYSLDASGQRTLINDTATAGYIPAYAKATRSLPSFVLSSPTGTGNRPDRPIIVQTKDGVGVSVNPSSIGLSVNGTTGIRGVTQAGGLTTIQYNGTWASGSTNTAMVWFADNEAVPVWQTNQFTFSALTYATLPGSYALSAGAVDTTKLGFQVKVFQTDRYSPYTLANAETMLAGQFLDPLNNPYPNKAATNTDGTHSFAQPNTLNYNIAAPAGAGDFTNDVQFPGLPGSGGNTNTFAMEAITYIYLPAGYYSFGVNSDDGFRLAAAANPHDEFTPSVIAVVDGPRGAADTMGAFGITTAGYYPFRLVYFQATGPASLELFSTAYTGARTLINDTNIAGSVRCYRSATNPRPYVLWAYPCYATAYSALSGLPVSFTLVDGTPAINQGSIQVTCNGTATAVSVTPMNGTNLIVSFTPTPGASTTTNTVQMTWADGSGNRYTNGFSFVLYGTETLAPLWTLPPGYKPYLTNDTTGTAMETGMGYNPVTAHLLVSSLTNQTGLRGIYILDALTGNDLGQLARTNAAGTDLFTSAQLGLARNPAFSVGVGDDGAIYAATMKPSSIYPYKLYRWASETSPAYLAYSESSSTFKFPLGNNFRVRGAGTGTQIIAGAGSSSSAYSNVVLFTTANGIDFTPTTLANAARNTDVYAGIAFGNNNTFYAEGSPGAVLECEGFVPATWTATNIATYTWTMAAGSPGPLAADLVNGRLIVLATSAIGGNAHSVNLFDLAAMTNSVNSPVDSKTLATSNANANNSGSVCITPNGAYAFVLDTQNGLSAFELYVKNIAITPARITHLLYGHPCTLSGTGLVNHAFVLLSSTNPTAALNLWTREQTNTAGTGSFSFSITPGLEKAKYFNVITQ